MQIGPAYEKYRLFVCVDCDPEHADPDDSDQPVYEKRYEVIVPVGDGMGREGTNVPESGDVSCPVENCPRCGAHLGFMAEAVVTVRDPKLDAWRARREAEQAGTS